MEYVGYRGWLSHYRGTLSQIKEQANEHARADAAKIVDIKVFPSQYKEGEYEALVVFNYDYAIEEVAQELKEIKSLLAKEGKKK